MTTVRPLLLYAPTLPSPSIPIISQVQQAPAPLPTTAPSTSLQDLPNFETRDEESFDPIPKTPENSDDEGNGEDDLGLNVGMESIFETTSQMDAQTPTSVAPLPMSAPTLT
nr:hypothetical protein [Tanacetum cinerariifolium]